MFCRSYRRIEMQFKCNRKENNRKQLSKTLKEFNNKSKTESKVRLMVKMAAFVDLVQRLAFNQLFGFVWFDI